MASTRRAAGKRTRSLNNMPAAADDETDNNNNDGFNVVQRKRRRRQGQQQQQHSRHPTKTKASAESQQLMHDVIESVASQQTQESSSSDSDSEFSFNNSDVNQSAAGHCAADEIKRLQATVKTLQNKVDFLLSFLGITQSSLPTNNNKPTHGSAKMASGSQTAASNKTYASAAAAGVHKLQGPVREAVLTTMYTELHARESMQNNIVVYGLGPVSDTSNANDLENFSNICDVEFGFVPEIVKTNRLGKPNTGKIRPLLVSLKSEQECKHLLKNAKSLRNSGVEYTRNNIFLSAQLTRAERQAAYEARCRRREQVAARQSADDQRQQLQPKQTSSSTPALKPRVRADTHKPASNNNTAISGPVTVQAVVHNSIDGPHSSAADSAQPSRESSSQLRVSAAEFTASSKTVVAATDDASMDAIVSAHD